MRFAVPIVLVSVAAIHALPLAGVLGASRLDALYGIAVRDPNLEILLRHRAVLFGLLAAFLAYAAFTPSRHREALLAGFVSVGSFLGLVRVVGGYNADLAAVVRADVLALGLLLVGAVLHVSRRGKAMTPGIGTSGGRDRGEGGEPCGDR